MIVDHQRRFLNVLFAAEAPENDLEKLGGQRERWLLYRSMVRSRMLNMIRNGIPRAAAALGEQKYLATYDAWLAEAPPRTRFIREIIPDFLSFALPRWNADKELPRWLMELARFEAARWEAGYLAVEWPTDAGDFDFEKVAVMNPTAQLLRLEHRVHEPLQEGETEYPAKKHTVLVYRRPDTDKTGIWLPNSLSADLIEGWMAGDRLVKDVVTEVCAKHGVGIDQKFIESLGGMLADFIERGVVLGAR